MIDSIAMSELQNLAAAGGQYSVSIYLPTHPGGDQTAQDPIRFKNRVAQARTELEALGVRGREIDDLLLPATTLHDDHAFWATMANGLAVFINASGMWTYRLREPVVELTVVAERFHLKALLPSLDTAKGYYLLALSQNEVRLLRGSHLAVSELTLHEIPASLADALKYDDREPQLQSHAGQRNGRGVAAIFHGQGAGKDLTTVDLGRFLTAVDAGFREIVGDSRTPLVLAGVDEVIAHYRKLSKYAHIVEGGVSGNPERLSPPELHDRAWPLVEPLLHEEQRAAQAAITSRSSPVLDSLPAIVAAADQGRIDSLFVPIGLQKWGSFDEVRRTAEQHDSHRPGDRDLLDVAAISTLAHSGRVFVVPASEIPGGTPVAAALRY